MLPLDLQLVVFDGANSKWQRHRKGTELELCTKGSLGTCYPKNVPTFDHTPLYEADDEIQIQSSNPEL